MRVSLAGGEVRGSKQPIGCFGASVNDLPESIDLNRWKEKRSLGQMEWIGPLVNAQLKSDLNAPTEDCCEKESKPPLHNFLSPYA
ncbi:hypothetical protein AVEN_54502-1 [Araneus ventricosus]|uniref:Uncharacterized protein n=1 Tax=Araneus ventricosus TaxID=182803 RepID=A0A4Y2EHW0_ARAVE|nr:hypothetical protein AVEN_54502-1 [Araneus ventricosus]